MNHAPTIGATMARVLMTAVVAAAMLLAMPAVAGAQQYPPPEITVENPAVIVTIEGSDWRPGTEVTIERRNGTSQSFGAQSTEGEVLTTVTTDRTGNFSADVAVPEGVELQLQAAGVGSSGEERVEDFVVTASPDGVTRSELPTSGFAMWHVLAIGAIALLVTGTGSVALARRRTS